MTFIQGLRRQEIPIVVPAVAGLDERNKDLDIQMKADIAQNCRFGDEIGSVTKRASLSFWNGTNESNPIQSVYRYYSQSQDTQFLLQLNGDTLRVGDDSAKTFSTLWTFGSSSGFRFTAVTYKDLALISTGKDPIVQTDGVVAWELGACKAVIASGGANLDAAADYSYKITFNTDVDGSSGTNYINGAVSNTVTTDASNRKVTLTNIPLGPATISSRVIFRTEGGGSTYYKIDTIADNSTTTYADDIADTTATAMGAVNHDVPLGKYLYIGQERLFVTGDYNFPNYIYHSDQLLPHWMETGTADITTTAAADYYDTIFEDDGDKITGVVAQLGVTYIFKQNNIFPYYIKGTPGTWTLGDSVTPVGCPAGYSIAPSEYGIVYQGWDHIYMFNGQYATPIVDEFTLGENILGSRIAESVGTYWNSLYLLVYTDKSGGNAYHDKVMVYDMLRKHMSKDVGGVLSDTSAGTGNVNINCFATYKGASEWGQLYAGDSVYGWVYQYDRTILRTDLDTKSDFDAGTHSDTISVGSETSPLITRYTLEDFEEHSTNTLMQAAWVTSETTEKIPPDLGTGTDGAKTVSEDETLSDPVYNYTALTVSSGYTLTIDADVVIKVQGAVTNGGTITVTSGKLSVYAVSIDNNATMSGNVWLRANTVDNTGGTITADAVQVANMSRTGNGSGTEGVRDGDEDTGEGFGFNMGFGGPDESQTTSITATLDEARTLTSVKYKASARAGDGGSSSCSWAIELWYSEQWNTVDSGSTTGDSSTASDGLETDSTGWTDVTKIKGTASAAGKGDVPNGAGYVYEMQAYYQPRVDGINLTNVTTTTDASTDDFINAVESFSETAIVNQGTYALRSIIAPGAITLNDTLSRTITSINLSDADHDTILIDVYALRSGTQFQFGMGESGGVFTDNLVNVPVATAGAWETVSLDFSAVADASKDAIIYLGLKFTNTDSYNEVYIDNIRSAINGTSIATWASPAYNISAATMGNMMWNENLNTYGGTHANTIEIFTRSGSTAAAVTDATACTAEADDEKFTDVGHGLVNTNRVIIGGTTLPTGIERNKMYFVKRIDDDNFYVALTSGGATVTYTTDGTSVTYKKWDGISGNATGLTTPSASAIQSTAADYFQFMVVFTCADTNGVYFPFLFKFGDYAVRFTYYATSTAAEDSISFRYRTGWRNFGDAISDKRYKRITSVHEGDTGSFDILMESDMQDTQTYTFSGIDLTTYKKRWQSLCPANMYGKDLRLEWRKDDLNEFKLKQYGLMVEKLPMV